MTVWVDDVQLPKKIGNLDADWSHLTASTPRELHDLAGRIGLKVGWFQPRCKTAATCPVIDGVCPHFHYDVTQTKRARAIAAGAVPIGVRDMGRITSARRKQFRSLLGTRPDVLTTGVEQGWADPTQDPTLIDWTVRQAAALVPFEVVDGRPVNPVDPALSFGRNELGQWGENVTADMAVFAHVGDQRYLLMAVRRDGRGCGLPGGFVEPPESVVDAAFRECGEETGLALDQVWCRGRTMTLPARYVRDSRAGREAWIVTVPTVVDLGQVDGLPAVQGADDVKEALWVPADNFLEVCMELAEDNIRMFAAHEAMLHDITNQRWEQ